MSTTTITAFGQKVRTATSRNYILIGYSTLTKSVYVQGYSDKLATAQARVRKDNESRIVRAFEVRTGQQVAF